MAKFQGHPFFDKPMRITYSKTVSDVVSKKNGTFVEREKRPKLEHSARATPMAIDSGASSSHTRKNYVSPHFLLRERCIFELNLLQQEVNMTPSSILFAQNLPADCTDAALSILFKVHTGFREVRMVPGKPGIAFVEFEDEFKATTALQSLHGFKLTPTDIMALSYAKR